MVFVTDVADALVAAALSKKAGFSYYNVATGTSISNNAILEMLHNHVGDFEVTHAPERKGDVKHTLAAVDKITAELGWEPAYSFATGLVETLKWWKLIDAE